MYYVSTRYSTYSQPEIDGEQPSVSESLECVVVFLPGESIQEEDFCLSCISRTTTSTPLCVASEVVLRSAVKATVCRSRVSLSTAKFLAGVHQEKAKIVLLYDLDPHSSIHLCLSRLSQPRSRLRGAALCADAPRCVNNISIQYGPVQTCSIQYHFDRDRSNEKALAFLFFWSCPKQRRRQNFQCRRVNVSNTASNIGNVT